MKFNFICAVSVAIQIVSRCFPANPELDPPVSSFNPHPSLVKGKFGYPWNGINAILPASMLKGVNIVLFEVWECVGAFLDHLHVAIALTFKRCRSLVIVTVWF